MTQSRYTIAPPSVAPLLHEYGDWDNIPESAWREYDAAQAYWARSRRLYAGPADDSPKVSARRNRVVSESKQSNRGIPAEHGVTPKAGRHD
jgi:hypothetical protein